MGDQGLQKALSAPWSYPFVRSCGAILSPRPHAVSADVSSGGQERARIARPRGLVLDGHEDGGTIAANGARGETMRDIDLFQLALGLVPPWMVVDAKFDADQKRLDIEIDFKTGGRFACPECGKADCPVHDTVKKTWRHLNFFQHEAFLHARVARIDCPDCGVRLVNVPWARPGSGFTLLFEAFVMALVKDMPVAAAARLVGEHDTRLWRVIQHYVETAVARMDLSELRRVAIDETAAKRGQDYISLFVDMDARKVVYVAGGNDAETVARFADHVDDHNSDASRIKEACIDMSAAYMKGVTENLTEAEITFDKFHAVKLINEQRAPIGSGSPSKTSTAAPPETGPSSFSIDGTARRSDRASSRSRKSRAPSSGIATVFCDGSLPRSPTASSRPSTALFRLRRPKRVAIAHCVISSPSPT